MANQEVDKLIAELSMILEQNRQKRNAADAMLMGIEQGKRRNAEQQRQEATTTALTAGDTAGSSSAGAGAGRSMRIGARAAGAGDDTAGFNRDFQTAMDLQQVEKDQQGQMQSMANPTDQAIAEEQRKRIAQQYAVAQGQNGPLGGAGRPAPSKEPLVPTPDLNAGGPTQYPQYQPGQVQTPPGAAVAQPGGLPAGWSQADYDQLSALSQRYPGG